MIRADVRQSSDNVEQVSHGPCQYANGLRSRVNVSKKIGHSQKAAWLASSGDLASWGDVRLMPERVLSGEFLARSSEFGVSHSLRESSTGSRLIRAEIDPSKPR